MNAWHDIDIKRITPREFVACIEIPKGSQCKYELDKESGMLILDRVLSTSTMYPANYGFIPKTYADDNDPLDVLVLCKETIAPMTLVKCYPIGVMIMIDNGQLDEKIIAIAEKDMMWNSYHNLDDLPPHYINEVKNFFEVYKMLEGKYTYIDKTLGREDAYRIIEEAIWKYKEKFEK